MDAKERSRLKNLNALRISNLEIPIKKATEAKATMQAALAKLSGREVNDMYTASYKEGEIAKVRAAYQKTMQSLQADVQTRLDELKVSLEEQHSELGLDNANWQNALKTIELAGKDLSGDTVRQITAQFAYDQPALRALQAVYKAKGLVYDGGIDAMIYDIPSTLNKLQNFARDAFSSENGSVFQFGVAVGKVANLEGVNFPLGNPFPSRIYEPSKIDVDGVIEAARAAAGLSADSKSGV
jgi:hypothetical protein